MKTPRMVFPSIPWWNLEHKVWGHKVELRLCSTTYWMCNMAQFTQPLWVFFTSIKRNGDTDLIVLSSRLNEIYMYKGASQVALVVKNQPANAGDMRDISLILGSQRSPGGGHGNPFQYSCLENHMDRRAWWATVHSVTQSETWLKQFSIHAMCMKVYYLLKSTP